MRKMLLKVVAVALLGVLCGWVVVVCQYTASERRDWRAREITGWCNHHRTKADTLRLRITQLQEQLGLEIGDDTDFIASAAITPIHRELLAIDREVAWEQRWYVRCAVGTLPELPPDRDWIGRSTALRLYLDAVYAAIPQRDVDDPFAYVAPLER